MTEPAKLGSRAHRDGTDNPEPVPFLSEPSAHTLWLCTLVLLGLLTVGTGTISEKQNNDVFFIERKPIMLQKTLSEVESELKKAEPASEPQTKGKRMVIEEVENSGDEGEKGSGDKGEDGGPEAGEASFLSGSTNCCFHHEVAWGSLLLRKLLVSPTLL